MRTTTLAHAGTASGIALVLIVAAPLAASAHVRVDPDQASAGSYSTLTFKVPTESATASTVKLEVDLPTDTPFGSVSYQPVAGWSVQVVEGTLPTPVTTDDGTVTEAPMKIIWTADAAAAGAATGIAPGQFQTFAISAGPVPSTSSVLLPAHQTYSDGSVVDWADAPSASGAEPEYPAPVLYIRDAPPSSDGAGAGAAVSTGPAVEAGTGQEATGQAATGQEATGQAATVSSGSSVTVPVVVAIAALVLAAVALVVAVAAITRRGRRSAGE